MYGQGEAGVHALDRINLELAEGEFVSIMGPSGSGKTTLLNILGCLDRPTSGSYLFDGVDVGHLADRPLSLFRNKTIGFVFQSFHLLPRLDVVQNVELPLMYAGVPRSLRRKIAISLIERVGLEHRLDHRPEQLSGGERQRVSVARALVAYPRVIIADEPTGNLDSRTGEKIMDLFNELNGDGQSIILITHDPEVASYAHRIVHFRDGRIESDKPNVPKRK